MAWDGRPALLGGEDPSLALSFPMNFPPRRIQMSTRSTLKICLDAFRNAVQQKLQEVGMQLVADSNQLHFLKQEVSSPRRGLCEQERAVGEGKGGSTASVGPGEVISSVSSSWRGEKEPHEQFHKVSSEPDLQEAEGFPESWHKTSQPAFCRVNSGHSRKVMPAGTNCPRHLVNDTLIFRPSF